MADYSQRFTVPLAFLVSRNQISIEAQPSTQNRRGTACRAPS